jgi:transcriptional regulator with XRE-family HTH domain
MESSAEVIRRLRLARGLSRAEACRVAGVSRATWSAVEAGASARPRPITNARIARALGVTPSGIWRLRPRPLHLEDVEDPRWRAAVLATAARLDREGTPSERRRLGERLITVLDQVDRGGRDRDSYDGRWDKLWQVGIALTLNPGETPLAIAVADGDPLASELRGLEEGIRAEALAARRAGELARTAAGRGGRSSGEHS